ncbi:MAG: retropepsin-like aspartic protease [Formivibrio sp.]|nr:retropepsin-like aspartic protease [Formivibrio sp.]
MSIKKIFKHKCHSLNFTAILFALILSSCAEQNPPTTEANFEALQLSFKGGDADLTCGLSCASKYGSMRPSLKEDYNSQNWSDLSVRILEVGFNNNQSWFYLASAAEGLGYIDAARIYYNEVLQSPRCDANFINVCDNIDVTKIAENKAMALGNESSQATNASVPAPPASTHDNVSPVNQSQSIEISESIANSTEISSAPAQRNEIKLVGDEGILEVPVLINGVLPLNFTIDSGASDVSIPADVALTLTRTGTLQSSDFIGTQTYTLADGSTVPSPIFIIRSLKVGNHVITNIKASISTVNGPLLLGQSFLSRFNSWSIDNGRQVLILK